VSWKAESASGKITSLRAARATRPGGGEAPREGYSLHGRAAWFELRRRARLEPMRCFGPSASLKARLRRDELTEAFGEGYDEAEEARIFALEELARQQSELEEAFGEGYDPEEEARLFAEEDAVPPAAPQREARGGEFGGEIEIAEGSSTRRRDASETVATSPRAHPKAPPKEASDGDGATVTAPSRTLPLSTPEDPPTKTEETELVPTELLRDEELLRVAKPANAPARAALAAEASGASPAARRTDARFAAETNERAPAPVSSSSLPPLDLGDPEKYRRLRETLGVEAALRTPLRRLLAPLEAAANENEREREKGNPDLFVPMEMPRGLLLPFAQHEAYGRLKLREIRQEDGSVGYGTRAAEGAGAPR